MSKRVDHNHSEIVKGLRDVGAFVQSIAAVGRGCPDLLVSFRNQWYVAEVKDGAKYPSQRSLTEAEKCWHSQATAPVHVWESVDDALKAIGASREI